MNPENLLSVENLNELRIFGLRRSGNHAIISWIVEGYSGVVVHLNNIRKNNPNPYLSFAQITVKEIPYWNCRPVFTGCIKHFIKRKNQANFSHKDPKVNIDYIRKLTPKQCLINSYENYRLDDNIFELFEVNRESYVGASHNRYEVLILRDPFNLFASLLKSNRINAENRDYLVDTYKQYAREFIGQTKILKLPKICINYNKWVRSQEYRYAIAQKLGIKISGDAYTKVPSEGGGSSFDNQKFNINANQMPIFERWKNYKSNSFYRDIFKDQELCQLSEEIFGQICTEIL